MLHACKTAMGRQQMIEVAPPPGWILARAIPAHLRPVQNGFDSPPHARRSLRSRRPDWLENGYHERSIDRRDRQPTNNRIHVGLQCRGPLLPMYRIVPAGLVGCEIPLGAPPEWHDPSRGFQGPQAHRLLML